ncbi:MAG: hypothetical protein F4X64_06120 [Chloroflexi bacterium]|nr:hypothetical protein [Chloroflexota bacterium]
MDNFEAMGIFWSPKDPDKKHQGVLTHTDRQETTLRLAAFSSATLLDFDPITQDLAPSETGEVIHGNTTEGQLTLLNWHKTNLTKGSGLWGSWTTETITVNEFLTGAHCNREIQISHWTVDLEAIKEWIRIGLRELNKDYDHGETGTGEIHIGTTNPGNSDRSDEYTSDQTLATMVYNTPRGLHEARRDISALEQMLTIATEVKSVPQNIRLRPAGSPQTCDYYNKPLQGSPTLYEPHSFHAPLPFAAINGSVGIATFLRHHHEFELPLHSMLTMQRQKSTNTVSELDFLSAWMAAEFYLGTKGTNEEKLAKLTGEFCTEAEKKIVDVEAWAKAAAKSRNDIVHANRQQPEPALWINSIEMLRLIVVRKILDICDLKWTNYTTGFGHQEMLSRLARTIKQLA